MEIDIFVFGVFLMTIPIHVVMRGIIMTDQPLMKIFANPRQCHTVARIKQH